MAVLAFDTCLDQISVALRHRGVDGAWSTIETAEEGAAGHAERLMPMIAHVLERAGMGFAQVSRVAVTLGPGTFTGVRTGIAAARAFRLAASVEIVGMTSLALMAHRAFEAGAEGGVLAVVDARRGRVYAQIFGSDALDARTEPLELTPDEAARLAVDHCAIAIGSGAGVVVAAASTLGIELAAGPAALVPRAADLAVLAYRLAPLAEVSPIYIRPPDAKPQTGKSLARSP